MAVSIPTDISNDLLDFLTSLIDTGGSGTVLFYTGTAPAVDSAIGAQVLAATVTLPADSFPAAASRSTTQNTGFTQGAVTAGGPHTVTFFRMLAGDSTHIAQGSLGTGAGDINFNSLTWQSGGNVNLTSLTLTIPETCA